MKTIISMFAPALALMLCGCAGYETVVNSLQAKNVAASGLVTDNRIGIDPETKSPVLKSVVVSGDFQTIKSDGNYINFKQEESGAWYNAQNKTKKTQLTITAGDQSSLSDVLKYALGVISKLPQDAEAKTETTGK